MPRDLFSSASTPSRRTPPRLQDRWSGSFCTVWLTDRRGRNSPMFRRNSPRCPRSHCLSARELKPKQNARSRRLKQQLSMKTSSSRSKMRVTRNLNGGVSKLVSTADQVDQRADTLQATTDFAGVALAHWDHLPLHLIAPQRFLPPHFPRLLLHPLANGTTAVLHQRHTIESPLTVV